MSSSFEPSWTPNSSTASGMRATDGIGRRNSMVEAVKRRRNVDEPTTRPMTTAATVEIVRPIAQPFRVSPVAAQKLR